MALMNIEEEPEIIDIGISSMNGGSNLKRGGQIYTVSSTALRRKPHKIKQGQQKAVIRKGTFYSTGEYNSKLTHSLYLGDLKRQKEETSKVHISEIETSQVEQEGGGLQRFI